jgi:hypothetical protein
MERRGVMSNRVRVVTASGRRQTIAGTHPRNVSKSRAKSGEYLRKMKKEADPAAGAAPTSPDGWFLIVYR